MTLIRILIIALVAWLLLRMLKNWINRYQVNQQHSHKPGIETIVRCSHCGLHIPKQEAIESDNKYYCSREHLRLHQDDPD